MDYDCAESPVVTVCYHDVTDLLSLSVTVMFISPVHVFIAADRWCRRNGFFFVYHNYRFNFVQFVSNVAAFLAPRSGA